MNALLALAASVLWGSSDFGGGLISRRIDPSAAVLISQAIALAGLVAMLPLAGVLTLGGSLKLPGFLTLPGGWYLLVAAVAGAVASLSLASFYRAMSLAPLSLVAPITAAGTAIPVLAGLARGDQLSLLQGAGMVVTIVGVILACGPEWNGGTGAPRPALVFALLAAVGFGIAYTLLALAAGAGSVYGTLLLQRVGGLVALGPIVLASGVLGGARLTRRRLAGLAAIGLSDILANGAYALAASRGSLPIAVMLASLYPVVTALLARGILAERLRPLQSAGVVAALAGVVLLST